MAIQPPRRWTPRSLTVMFLPHLFRNPRNAAESIGPRSEKVPLDADKNHEFIKRKKERMLKSMNQTFALNTNPPQDAPKKATWSIATGVWVSQHLLKHEYIFPFSLGPMISQEVSGRIMFRNSANGMMIPPAVGLAFNEVSKAPAVRSWKGLRQRRSFSSLPCGPASSPIAPNCLGV